MKRGFVIHWNGDVGAEARCVGQPHTRCESFWAAVKRYHMESRGWSDIAYSFGVCPHGIRLTGRGWDKNQFANGADIIPPNDGADSEWYTVLVFIGGAEKPTTAMVSAVITLIGEGRKSGRCGQRVLPHNAFKPKTCPGPDFTAHARAWDNRPLTEEDDDMNIDECRTVVRSELQRGLAFLMAGKGNALTAGQDWVTNAVTLPQLLTAVAGIDVELDPVAIADAIPESIAQDVAEALVARLAE